MSRPADAPQAARLTIDYPDRPLDRLSTLLRPIWAIPILIVLWLTSGSGISYGDEHAVLASGGLLVLPTAAMLVVRRKYPRWWFDFNRELTRFGARVGAYLALLDDRYPSTDDEQAVHLELDPPDPQHLNRWLPLVKWLLAIPHYLVLAVLWIAVVVVVVWAWVAILATGRYPRGAFDFVVGVARWQLRVAAYSTLLITDRYPPFSLR
ncbi:DUF4389 domain-containing protein [Patulibacter defluvii]|uniref:DUF4389 domain-containing protein n=1 Tax=Patulibacter defluvii TaxID=3095358 RepID=UPI002A7573D1|nr:DUF4389 domain-containing protein [Patulibacter sp. DM4]